MLIFTGHGDGDDDNVVQSDEEIDDPTTNEDVPLHVLILHLRHLRRSRHHHHHDETLSSFSMSKNYTNNNNNSAF